MKYLFRHFYKEIGSFIQVEIDPTHKLVFRSFIETPTIVNGNKLKLEKSMIKSLFKNELYWLTLLEGRSYIPKLYNVDEKKQLIVQEYLGEDLLIQINENKVKWTSDFSKQLVDIFNDLYGLGILKRNTSLSNMGLRKNKLIFFDFKWSCYAQLNQPSVNPNSEGATCYDDELYAINKFISKISEEDQNKVLNCYNQYFKVQNHVLQRKFLTSD